MNMKSKLMACIALGLLAACTVANAVPLKMNIELREDGFGGSGATWFGTFATGEFNPDGSFWVVESFSAAVNGLVYDRIHEGFGLFLFLDPNPSGPLQLLGVVTPGELTETPVDVLQFDARFINDVPDPVWAFTPCSTLFSCGGSIGRFHYTLTPVATDVPEPGTLGLFACGLAALLSIRRRRPD